MKNLLLLLILMSGTLVFGQTITSVTPTYGHQGDNQLPVTIVGNGTSFSQGSPTTVNITQGFASLVVAYVSSTVSQILEIEVTIPPATPLGYYNMEINDTGGNINLPAGFSVLPNTGDNVMGRVIIDQNQNCTEDLSEVGVTGVNIMIQPLGIVTQTSTAGYWTIPSLPVGTYTVVMDTTIANWDPTCSVSQSLTISNSSTLTVAPVFGMINTTPCPDPNVSIVAPFMRRCFSDQRVYVSACNGVLGTGVLTAAYVDVELDPLMVPTSATLPYTSLGNDVYRFQVGNIDPGQCVDFYISTDISCNAVLEQTLCMDANLYPVDPCSLDSIPSPPIPIIVNPAFILPQPCLLPWDNSSMEVEGWCQNDSAYFSITNTGQLGGGDMMCYSPVLLYVNDTLTFVDSIMLQGQETVFYSFDSDGETFVLQAPQHPLHPGNSNPNAHVEMCGSTLNWIPGMVNNLPLNDADPVVDIFCGQITGSYDPNDKRGFPVGITDDHLILPTQDLEYLIRFQNTGTDTAFNIVVRDTLDTDLDIFSVTPGVSSHPYEFKIYGPRVLEWSFNLIMLPDSTTDQAGSNGFLTFKVDPIVGLPNGTLIKNDADIYFDFNLPIITNETVHRIDDFIQSSPAGIQVITFENMEVVIYPNPTNGLVTVEVAPGLIGKEYAIMNLQGQIVKRGVLNAEEVQLNLVDLVTGIYMVQIENSTPVKLLKH